MKQSDSIKAYKYKINLKHNIMKTKKIMRSIGALMTLFAVISFVMIGCSKDDSEEIIKVDPTEKLIGNWRGDMSGANLVIMNVNVGRRELRVNFSMNEDGTLKGMGFVRHYISLGILGEKSFSMDGALEDIKLTKDSDCPWNISFEFSLKKIPVLGSYSMAVSPSQLDCNGTFISANMQTYWGNATREEVVSLAKD